MGETKAAAAAGSGSGRVASARPAWLGGAVATMVLCVLLVLPVALPAIGHLAAPWGASDMTAYYFLTDTWDWWRHGFTADVAFPFGMDSNVYAGLDGLTHVVAAFISWVAGNAFVGLNLLLLLSFPIVALLAYAAVRLVGLTGPLAAVLATSFTFIPFHFGRGIGHVHLGMMFGLVTGVLVALLIGSGRLTDWFQGFSGKRSWGRLLLVVGLVLVTSWTGIYYAFFGIALAAAAVLWRVGQGDSRRSLTAPVLTVLAQVVASAVGLLPVLWSRINGPASDVVGLRDPLDSVTYAGNLAIALVPQPYSVVSSAYNEFVNGLFTGTPANEAHLMANFGTWVTSAALVTMLVGLVTHQRQRSLRATAQVNREFESDPRRASITFIAYLISVVVILFVPWSVNYLFAQLVTAQIRAWNRLEPYLLLLFILGAAAALASWKWPRRAIASWTVSALIVAVTLVEMVLPWRNLYVQIPSGGQEKIDTAFAYAREVQSALPEGCGILTLPFIEYPNAGPIVNMDDYDHFLLTLTNPRNPISYGAYRGSPQAAQIGELSASISGDSLWDLRELGFCGIHVDSAGYEDPSPLLSQLETQFGAPVAQQGRWTLFSVSPTR